MVSPKATAKSGELPRQADNGQHKLSASPAVATLGRHLLVELHGCQAARLDSVSVVVAALEAAAQRIEATIVGKASHRYTPQGVTAILLIAESHLSIHTWPEEGYAAVDLYTCGQLDPKPAVDEVRRRLGATRCEQWEVRRGGAALAIEPGDTGEPL